MSNEIENTIPFVSEPDESGHFGPYGGTYVAETLIHALDELKEEVGPPAERRPEPNGDAT